MPDEYLKLSDYQRKGAIFLASMQAAMLADEPGLGKTATAIHAADMLDEPHVFVVCPKSLIAQWRSEIQRFSLNPSEARWQVTNYERVPHAVTQGLFTPNVMIVDESTFIKNPTAKRTQAVLNVGLQVIQRGGHVWFLTGTPIRNTECDLFYLMFLAYSGLRNEKVAHAPTIIMRSYMLFKEAYFLERTFNVGSSKSFTKITGLRPEKRAEFLKLLQPVMLHRTKKLLNLPPLSEESVYCDWADDMQRRSYESAKQGVLALEDGETKNITNLFAQLMRLRQIALSPPLAGTSGGSAKTDAVKTLIQEVYDDRPFLVFTEFASYAEALAKELHCGCFTGTGHMSETQRQAAKAAFMAGKLRGLVLTAEAGGFGHNFQRASLVVFTDLPWTNDVKEQCVDRAFRRGQENEVHVVTLLQRGTIDEYMLRVLQRKRAVADRVLNAQQVFQLMRQDALKGGELSA